VDSPDPIELKVLRYLDLFVLVIALPIFLVSGLPVLGWAATSAAWLVQRALTGFVNKRARASTDPRTVAGLLTANMIARGWIMAGSIFAAGMADRIAGLSAAILAVALFTFYMTGRIGERR